jgi:hypothetical protein
VVQDAVARLLAVHRRGADEDGSMEMKKREGYF